MSQCQALGTIDLPRDAFSDFPEEAEVILVFRLGNHAAVVPGRFLSNSGVEGSGAWGIYFNSKPIFMHTDGSNSTFQNTVFNYKSYSARVWFAYRFSSSSHR